MHARTHAPSSHFKRARAHQRILTSWHNTSCRLWKSHTCTRQRNTNIKVWCLTHTHKHIRAHMHSNTHFPWNESYIKNYYFYGSHWVERFRWLSLCWVQIRPFLCLIHADGPKITPQWLPYCITMPKCMYNCIMSAHIYKHTHSNTHTVPHRMSEARVSVLNCNGPCQIKGKVFLCPPSNSINIPSAMNS